MSKIFKAVKHDTLVPFDGKFKLKHARTAPPKTAVDKPMREALLKELSAEMASLQHTLYAANAQSLLLVFQAMDAAGKDSTVRGVLSGLDPAGCQVTSFKAPSLLELDHDFLWRTSQALPERGRIGVFNRSYYEEVLVVRVHPEFLARQKLPKLPKDMDNFWEHRLDSIRDHEKHLARNGTVIIKFWLNVSSAVQRERFLSRLEEPEKNWKFNVADVAERAHWDAYMSAYEQALRATSREHAPWYAIPADSKSYMQLQVAEVIVKTLKSLKLTYPAVAEAEKARFAEMKKLLNAER